MMVEKLVNLLPEAWRDKAKAIVAFLGALVGLLTVVLPDSPQWLTVAVTVATALGVYAVPNVKAD